MLDQCSGDQAIPLMQIVLMLTTDLDGNHEAEQNALNQLLNALVERLEMNPPSQASQVCNQIFFSLICRVKFSTTFWLFSLNILLKLDKKLC